MTREVFEDHGIKIPHDAFGNVKTQCPQCSSGRKNHRDPCLSVNVSQGVWNCHHCNWSGFLRASDRGNRFATPKPKVYSKPVHRPLPLVTAALDVLASRGISAATAEAFKIGRNRVFFPGPNVEASCIDFPYYRNGELINVKHRAAKDKWFTMEKDCELTFFNLDCISGMGKGDALVIVEGEYDALAVYEAGHKFVISVPNGAPAGDGAIKLGYLDSAIDALEKVDKFIIATDGDAPGERLASELIRRLGSDRCSAVRWPEGVKDANDLLLSIGSTGVMSAIVKAKPVPISGVFTAFDFVDALDEYWQNGAKATISTGWGSMDEFYKIMPGELTVVTGIPNSGKSNWIDALMINLMRFNDWRFGIYTPENFPIHRHISRLIEIATGKPFFTGLTEPVDAQDIYDFVVRANDSIFWLSPDENESATLDWLLGKARSLVRRHGINGFILDPWNEIEHERPSSMTETDYIGASLRRIKRFAKDCSVHVWVVAHPTKLKADTDGNFPIPTPYDINGGANWRNKADVCLCVWRDMHDLNGNTSIHVQKVRNKDVGKIGVVDLRYNKVCGQYSVIGPVSDHDFAQN